MNPPSLESLQGFLLVLAAPVGTALGVTLALLVCRHYLLRWLKALAGRAVPRLDELLVQSLRTPTVLWCLATGLMVGLEMAPLRPRLAAWGTSLVAALVILSVTIVVANALARGLQHFGQRVQIETAVTGLGTTLIKLFVFILGGLLILGTLGISVTPLLAALGVGGLAVGLALQDTLSNLFAGVHLLLEKPVRVGDYVKLESGQEGYVTDIGWRTTRIRMLPNNMIIVPNAKLAQSILTNYYLPEQRMSLLVPISVSYGSDPEQVEKILVEEATRAAGEVPGLLAEPAPFVRFIPGFGESSLDFTLICQVREFVDQYLAQHELRKRIFRRFREEGIEIPFPQRVVHVLNGDGRHRAPATPVASANRKKG
ncbi:MAG TPA: mechanosensitive ion channel family protein, partial [Candidatus Methylomirabilis sp.]|nr:mechanosensitive ion channel family protein [Candidatus Methylomirabilis sp.]